ncbi:MAG: class I mannose-6-phosphate isomerase [Muribaculaceae bacterium]|nr:class I mannose-6-phosphate isomerase [Muribaculaceae bacterium]
MQIYKFNSILKPVLWGGDKLVAFKGLPACDEPIGESWELSAMPGRESVVADGADKGLTLTELVRRHGADLVGEDVYRRYGDQFPLLIKLIDARRDLSIQVHPGDEQAMRLHGCKGKTEMWYILDADEGATITTGFRQSLSPEQFVRHLEEGTILDIVNTVSSHPGDVFYIPSGQIHSIGAGNLLVEVQQTCDITYRVFDYNRRDADGNLRELHTEPAREALDYAAFAGLVSAAVDEKGGACLLSCPFFEVSRIEVEDSLALEMPMGHSFVAVMCIEGAATLQMDGASTVALSRGETALIPAVAARVVLTGPATVLTATVPDES